MKKKVTHEQTRVLNRQLVTKTIYDAGEISRAEVARVTRLTRPTVSDLVAELMSQRLVVEVGYAPSTGGKRPMLLRIDADAQNTISIDLSRKDFCGAVLDLRGEVQHREYRRWRNDRPSLDLIFELVDSLVAAADRPLLGIGVGTPGLIDAAHGVVVAAVNQEWTNVPLRQLLEERYGVPAYVANDCQAAALGEFTFGNVNGVQDLVVISVGWGIGAGIVVNGQLLHGTPFGAGEIGHIVVAENGERCSCGGFGCLETVSSSQAIVRQVHALLARRGDPRVISPEQVSFDRVCELFHEGDAEVREVVRAAGRGLGTVAAYLVGVLGIYHLRFAGQVTAIGPFLLEAVREEMVRLLLPALAGETQLEFATLGSDIVLKGASALVLHHELGVL